MLRADLNDTPSTPDHEVLIPHTGAWGTVTAVIDTTVKVAVQDFDNGEHFFGPVPFHPATATPATGDQAFLHFDHDGRPAYAAVFT